MADGPGSAHKHESSLLASAYMERCRALTHLHLKHLEADICNDYYMCLLSVQADRTHLLCMRYTPCVSWHKQRVDICKYF